MMTISKKYTLPEIPREGMTPKELEVLAWVEELVEMANGLQLEPEQLDTERLEQALAELIETAKQRA